MRETALLRALSVSTVLPAADIAALSYMPFFCGSGALTWRGGAMENTR
jgi:hypothetical protein